VTKVLVTGGAGFIGSNLVDRLLAEGHSVTVVDDLSTGHLYNLHTARRDPEADFSFVRLDLLSDGLERAVAKAEPEVVVHLAAQVDVRRSVTDPVRDAMVNVVGTVNLLEASRRNAVGKVVFTTSGGCIYGEPGEDELPVTEDHPGHGHSPYGAAKRAAEEYLPAYEELYGLRWTSLALGNVYGPRQDPKGEAGVVAILGGRMIEGRDVTIYGDGRQTRDFVFVGDVVDAIAAALDAGDGQRLNVGTGRRTSVNELFTVLAELTDYDRPPSYGPRRTGELEHIALDVFRAIEVLGWSPATDLRDGLERTLGWLRG
jgi:UDP-glucose 4-epimerase